MLRDLTPLTGSRPSTRTIVPMPTGESSARPEMELVRRVRLALRGDDAAEQLRPCNRSHGGAHGARSLTLEEFFTVTDPIDHPVPPRVGQRERRCLGEDPARDFVGAPPIRSCVAAVGMRDLDAHAGPTSGRVPRGSRRRRYQLATVVRFGESRGTRSTARRARGEHDVEASPSAYSVRWLFTTPTVRSERHALAPADAAVDESGRSSRSHQARESLLELPRDAPGRGGRQLRGC